jgi:hypothetical protein
MLTAIACLISAIAAPAAAQEAPTIIPFDLSPQHKCGVLAGTMIVVPGFSGLSLDSSNSVPAPA